MDYKVIFTENSIVFIDGIYHQLQDYENKMSILDFGWDFTNLWIPLFFVFKILGGLI